MYLTVVRIKETMTEQYYNELQTCEECKSEYFAHASKLSNLCPQCSHILYGYNNCDHEFENDRCKKCYWNGNASDYIKSLKKVNSYTGTINCLNCNKVIAKNHEDGMDPPPENCYEAGNVPVPNLGWFCSQECANQFGLDNNLTFERNAGGLIDYYGKS